MTWVAFDRGIKSVEKFGFKAPLEKWRALRDMIHAEVCDKGFDRELNSFVEFLWLENARRQPPAAAVGRISAAADPRIRGTMQAIERHLMRDGFVLRHDPREVIDESSRSRARFSPARCGWRTPMCWPATLPGRRRCSTASPRSPTISACSRRNTTPRQAADRQFSAGADPYRPDQHRAQSQRRQARRRKARGAAVEVGFVEKLSSRPSKARAGTTSGMRR